MAKKKKDNRGRPTMRPRDRRRNRLVLKLTDEEREMVFSIFDQPSVRARQLILRDARRKEAQA